MADITEDLAIEATAAPLWFPSITIPNGATVPAASGYIDFHGARALGVLIPAGWTAAVDIMGDYSPDGTTWFRIRDGEADWSVDPGDCSTKGAFVEFPAAVARVMRYFKPIAASAVTNDQVVKGAARAI